MAIQAVTPELLANLEPFSGLDAHQLLLVSHQVTLLQIVPRQTLFEVGDDTAVEYFLLEGTLQLRSDDGKVITMAADQPSARKPLARLRPRKYSAIAQTPCVLGQIRTDLCKALESEGTAGGEYLLSYGVSEISADDDPTVHIFVQEFHEALASKRLVLPSLPEVALRIRQLIEDDRTDAATLAAVINADPAIAAKLIRAANSPLYAGASACTSTQQAIVRLGVTVTRQLVLSFAIRDLFVTNSRQLKRQMLVAWKQSMEVAAISYVVAGMSDRISVTCEEAMLAGLVHDVGLLAILTFAQNYPSMLEKENVLLALRDRLSGELGELILSQWNFREDFIAMASGVYDWHREHSGGADLCDVVQVAKLHSYLWSKLPLPTSDIQSLPALQRLDLGELTPELTLCILDEAKHQVGEVKSMLMG